MIIMVLWLSENCGNDVEKVILDYVELITRCPHVFDWINENERATYTIERKWFKKFFGK